MVGTCLTCGHRAELEAHHVAGRHNHPIVVLVCVDCHRILSRCQLAAGIELRADAPRTDVDRLRALLVGAVQLLQLFGQRHPDHIRLPSPLATLTGRAGSRLLDALADPTRPGRWLPDPTVPPTEVTPLRWPLATEVERATDLAGLMLILLDVFGEPASRLRSWVAEVAADPPNGRPGSTPAPRTAPQPTGWPPQWITW
jgi:hypothetical protein